VHGFSFGLPITGPYESVFEAGSHDSQRMIRTKAEGPRVWVDTYYPVMNEPVSRGQSISYVVVTRSLSNSGADDGPDVFPFFFLDL
jgi:hypothetical protein